MHVFMMIPTKSRIFSILPTSHRKLTPSGFPCLEKEENRPVDTLFEGSHHCFALEVSALSPRGTQNSWSIEGSFRPYILIETAQD